MSIIPDESHPPETPARGGRRWPSIVMAGLALVLAFAVFRETEPAAQSAIPDPGPTSTSIAKSRPLAELVPGFVGTLHAVEESEGFRIITWNSEQPLSQAPLSEGRPDDLGFDAAGELLGVSLRDSASGAGTLFVRDESGLVQLDFDISSFAWHQTEPGVMAAVLRPIGSDEPELVTMVFGEADARPTSVQTVITLESNDIILASGTWGFLIRRQEGAANAILLLDENGEQVWARAAHWAYASPTGDILLSFYSNETREFRAIRPTTPLTERGAWFELPSLGVTAVGWSPRAEVAVVTYQGSGAESRLFIYDSNGNLLEEMSLGWRVWGAEWSRSGRFVIMPGIDGGEHTVLFYDTEEKRLTPVAFDGQILTAVIDG